MSLRSGRDESSSQKTGILLKFSGKRPFFQRGRGLLEFAVAVIIAGTAAAVFLHRVAPAMDVAEVAAVKHVEGQLKALLAVESATHVAAGAVDAVESLDGVNPVRLMAETPRNYVGERLHPAGDVERGRWYYATDAKELRYRPNLPRSQRFKDRPKDDLAFRVALVHAEGDEDRLFGVRLVRTQGSDWLLYDGR